MTPKLDPEVFRRAESYIFDFCCSAIVEASPIFGACFYLDLFSKMWKHKEDRPDGVWWQTFGKPFDAKNYNDRKAALLETALALEDYYRRNG